MVHILEWVLPFVSMGLALFSLYCGERARGRY